MSFADPVTFNGITNATGQVYLYSQAIQHGKGFVSFGSVGNYWEAWSDGSWWSDSLAPSADKEYIVCGGKLIAGAKTAGSTVTFNGKKLILGNWNSSAPTEQRDIATGRYSYGTQDSGWIGSYTATLNFENDGLEVRYGGFQGRDTRGSTVTVNGKVEVTSPAAFPAWIFMSWVDMTWIFNGPFSSAAGTQFDSIQSGSASNRTTLKFLGGMSDYYGTLNLSNRTYGVFADGTVMPGKLKVGKKSRVQTSSSSYVGAVRFGELFMDGSQSELLVSTTETNTTFTIDNGIKAPVGQKPVISYSWPGVAGTIGNEWLFHVTNDVVRCPKIIDVPATDPSVLSSCIWSNRDATGWSRIWRDHGPQLVERIEGDRRRVYLDIPKMTHMLESSGIDALAPGNADRWYGGVKGEDLSPDVCYFISNSKGVSTPAGSHYTFNGKRLVASHSNYVTINGNVTFNDLHIGTHARLIFRKPYGAASTTFDGKITVFGDIMSNEFKFDSNYGWVTCFHLDDIPVKFSADIAGDGIVDVDAAPVSWTYPKHSACAHFLGDNRAFRGRFRVLNTEGAADGHKTYLAVTNAMALGSGSPKSDVNKSIELLSGGGLRALATMAIDDAERGFYVGDGTFISVPGRTDVLTLGSSFTLAGGVTKEGEGTLALAAKPVQSGAPAITVGEGALMPTATDALDGIAVTVADGAALAIDGDSADTTYRAMGLDLSKANVVFSGAKRLVVKKNIDFSSDFISVEVVLASGSAEEVSAFVDGLSVVFSNGKTEKRCAVDVRDAASGRQVVATLVKGGMRLIVR